jgi:DNA-binding NtrC family response regulator
MEGTEGPRRKCILVVDDDVHQHGILRVLLARYGYSTLHATTLDQARAVLAGHEIDLIILDIRLHREHGLDLLFGLPLQGIEVPVIICTSDAFAEFTYRTAKSAVAGWIVKPYTFLEMMDAVHGVIGTADG